MWDKFYNFESVIDLVEDKDTKSEQEDDEDMHFHAVCKA